MPFVAGRITVDGAPLPFCVVELWTTTGLAHAAPGELQTFRGAQPARRVGPPSRTDAQGRFALEAGSERSGLFLVYRLEDRWGSPAPSSFALVRVRYGTTHDEAWSLRYPTAHDPPLHVGTPAEVRVPSTSVPVRVVEIDPGALQLLGVSTDPLPTPARDAARSYVHAMSAALALRQYRDEARAAAPRVLPRLGASPPPSALQPPPLRVLFPAMTRVTATARAGAVDAEMRVQPLRAARVNLGNDVPHEYYHHAFHHLVAGYAAPGGRHGSRDAWILRGAIDRRGGPEEVRDAFVEQLAMDLSEGSACAFADVVGTPSGREVETDRCATGTEPAFGDDATERYLFVVSRALGAAAGGSPALGFCLLEHLVWAHRHEPHLPFARLGAGRRARPFGPPITLPGLHGLALRHLPPAASTAATESLAASGLDRTLQVWNEYVTNPRVADVPFDPALVEPIP